MALRINPESAFGALTLRLAAGLIRWLLLSVCRTYRLEIVGGREHLDALLDSPRPILFSFWHNRLFLFANFFQRVLRDYKITVLASRSRDGELAARVAGQWGLHVVRGSATRGGLEALRAIHRAIRREGSSPVMIPDGPHGPTYEFKVGVAVLSQVAQVPILPVGLAARNFLTIGSWDRLIVPWPFSRVAIAFGPLHQVPRGLSPEDLETERRHLQDQIDKLTRQTEEKLGVDDVARPWRDRRETESSTSR